MPHLVVLISPPLAGREGTMVPGLILSVVVVVAQDGAARPAGRCGGRSGSPRLGLVFVVGRGSCHLEPRLPSTKMSLTANSSSLRQPGLEKVVDPVCGMKLDSGPAASPEDEAPRSTSAPQRAQRPSTPTHTLCPDRRRSP
jgi:hypothetical protein